MKIGLVGAYDRYNYGDLLMPIVVEKEIKNKFYDKNIEFKYYGLSYSNMKYAKGKSTEPLKNLYDNPCDVVIIVGGQVLSANYTGMYMNLLKSKLKILFYKVLKKFLPSYTERICKNKFKCPSIKPWVLNKGQLKCKKLIYNTVGGNILEGTNDNTIDNIKECVKLVDYISIREKSSYDIIQKINNEAKLYPDSVISISELISEKELEENVSKNIINMVEKNDEYFVFQIKNRYGKNNIDEIAKQIELIYKKTGMKCILLPIGYAQGHEDQIVLKKIYKKISTECSMIDFCNIYEIIYIIKNSKLYVGTSLHGAITAITYEIPHFIASEELDKLNSYLTTWNSTPIINSNISELCANVVNIMNNYENAKKLVKQSRNKIMNLVEENFININRNIEEVLDNE